MPLNILRNHGAIRFGCIDRETYSRDQMLRIDDRIERDLHKFVDGALTSRISKVKEDVLLWMVTLEIVRTRTFSIAAQAVIQNRFGKDTLTKLRSFLNGLPGSGAEAVIFDKTKIRASRARVTRSERIYGGDCGVGERILRLNGGRERIFLN
jgi:hypothetical protein